MLNKDSNYFARLKKDNYLQFAKERKEFLNEFMKTIIKEVIAIALSPIFIIIVMHYMGVLETIPGEQTIFIICLALIGGIICILFFLRINPMYKTYKYLEEEKKNE